MFGDQQSAKLAASQQDACKSPENQTACGAALREGYSPKLLTHEQETVRQLQNGADASYATANSYKRVADILMRHPEFHEFLEVLRSGLV